MRRIQPADLYSGWVIASFFFALGGSLLLAVGAFSRLSYVVLCLLAAAAVLRYWRRNAGAGTPRLRLWPRRRFRHPLPALFLIGGVLTAAGAVLYAPSNYDFLCYRFPRLLHWSVVHGWAWIETDNYRMNVYSPGQELLLAPLYFLFRTDRVFPLVNLALCAFLPGLTFSVFRHLGVSGRVAWNWMWIAPFCYVFVTQAGGAANDITGSGYFLLACFFLFRARRTGRPEDLCLCGFAAAVVTAIKLSNLPLLLPLAVGGVLLWRVWIRRPGLVVLTGGACVLASCLPTLVVNHLITGDWTGDPGNVEQMRIGSPWLCLAGNALLILSRCVQPPLLPHAAGFERQLAAWIPDGLQRALAEGYSRFSLALRELPLEESSGVGIAVTLLAGIAVLYSVASRRRSAGRPDRLSLAVLGGFWIAAFTLLAGVGHSNMFRVFAPYYPLALATILLTVRGGLMRRKWWQITASGVVLATAMPVFILPPARPLWPAQTVLSRLASRSPDSRLIQRAVTSFDVYRRRPDPMAELRLLLPPDARRIGFIGTGDDISISLWRPFGERTVEEIPSSGITAADRIRCRALDAIVAREEMIAAAGLTADQWAASLGGKVSGRCRFTAKVGEGAVAWIVIVPLRPSRSPAVEPDA